MRVLSMKHLICILFLFLTLVTPHSGLTDSHLSSDDLKLYEFLKEAGIIPQDVNEEIITPELMMGYRLLLKEEFGIDDINSISEPDPRFSSPEKTWEVYKGALISDDFQLAMKCLMPRFAKKQEAIRNTIGSEKMREMAKAMRPIERIIVEDNRAKFRIKRRQGEYDITHYIYFINENNRF